MTDLEPVILLYEEYESLRLSDYEGLTQEQSAEIVFRFRKKPKR